MASSTTNQLLSAFEYPRNKRKAIRLLSAFPDQSEIKNIKDSDFYLIHKAASNGWTEIIELLVTAYHCNPNCTSNWGSTSLHFACLNEHLLTVKLLTTQYCLNPLQTTSEGYDTPLDCCRGETKRYLQQIIGKCVCLYVYCLYICTLLKYSKQQITLFTTLKYNKQ